MAEESKQLPLPSIIYYTFPSEICHFVKVRKIKVIIRKISHTLELGDEEI